VHAIIRANGLRCSRYYLRIVYPAIHNADIKKIYSTQWLSIHSKPLNIPIANNTGNAEQCRAQRVDPANPRRSPWLLNICLIFFIDM